MNSIVIHEALIKRVIHSFLELCDYMEEHGGCSACPVATDCQNNHKHEGLHELLDELDVGRQWG